MRLVICLLAAGALAAGCGGNDGDRLSSEDLPWAPARVHVSSAANHGGREGQNSAGKIGWTAPCPPKGDAAHRSVWSVYRCAIRQGATPAPSPARSPPPCATACSRAARSPRATGADPAAFGRPPAGDSRESARAPDVGRINVRRFSAQAAA